jgi:hypothetical protein
MRALITGRIACCFGMIAPQGPIAHNVAVYELMVCDAHVSAASVCLVMITGL